MNSDKIELLVKNKYKFVLIDNTSKERIEKISSETGADATSVVASALEMMETAIGHEVLVKSKNKSMKINLFKKFKQLIKI